MTISICIPTCNRPELLRQCLESCVRQTLRPHEILVGDDSRDDASGQVVEEFTQKAPCPVRYLRNIPPKGQGGNVDRLLRETTGELICLIHDDDTLAPDALEVLAPCLVDPSVVVAFGKQVIVDHEGGEDAAASVALNESFRRTAAQQGLQDDLMLSALTQQFPNNGYLIRADLAREVGYLEPIRRFGDACDFGFAVLCAQARPQGRAFFVDKVTAYYRVTKQSVSRGRRSADNAYQAFKFLHEQRLNPVHQGPVEQLLKDRAAVAIGQAINLGHTREAWSWYFGRWHRHRILTPGGARRFLRLLHRSLWRKVPFPPRIP